VEEFRYLGKSITNQNSIMEIIEGRNNSGNACYHSVQNLLPSTLLAINLEINTYRNIILPVVLCGCETWLFTLREERRLRVFENRACSAIEGEERRVQGFVENLEGKRQVGRTRSRSKDNSKMDLQEVGCGVWAGSSWLKLGTGGGHL